MSSSRRDAIKLTIGAGAAFTLGRGEAVAAPATLPADKGATNCPASFSRWGKGPEGRRKADLGNGRYRNPVLPGDYPDPTVLRDGEDYYLTHSSIDAMPGLLIWHSRDLVNWSPVCAALSKPLGTVFACDIVKHDERYFIYIPFMKAPWSPELPSFANTYVIHADHIAGPWSDPVAVGVGGFIDPGHAVGEDGHRYLFLSGVSRVRLTADGLRADGPIEQVYEGWRYPDEWIVEGYSLEGPKIARRGDWFYLFSAVGGTSGPATGHMVIVARSRSIHGPWKNCPDNPIVRTASPDEPWHSRGHATAVEGPGGQWYLVYHGYENGYHTLGRQTLLEPIDWTQDGWPRARGGDLSRPLPFKPRSPAGRVGAPYDDFGADSLGMDWNLRVDALLAVSPVALRDGAMTLSAKGAGPQDGTIVTRQVGERAYRIEVAIDIDDGAEGGLLLYFNDRMFFGMGYDGKQMQTYGGGRASYWREPVPAAQRIHMRIDNDHHVLTYYWSLDGKSWTRHGVRAETSGVHANTMNDLASLRPALFAAGEGAVRFRDFCFAAQA